MGPSLCALSHGSPLRHSAFDLRPERSKSRRDRAMPVKLRFTLEGPPPEHPFRHATGIRALALRWIQMYDATLATEIHDSNTTKPYSISPIWADAAGPLCFDVAILADHILEPMIRGASQSSDRVRLGRQTFRLGKPTMIADCTWTQLLSPPRSDVQHLDFRLFSPTA